MSNLERPSTDSKVEACCADYPGKPLLNEDGFLADHSRNNLVQLFGRNPEQMKNVAYFIEPQDER